MRGETVTKEIVVKVKSYLSDDKYNKLTQSELSLLTGVSTTTINRIANGSYDHLLEKPVTTEDVTVPITYDTLKRLLACEYVVDGILKNCMLHDVIEDALFINNKVLYGLLRAYLPEDVEATVKKLKEVENE